MSDTVDDLHQSEDFSGSAIHVIEKLLAAIAEHRPTILRLEDSALDAAMIHGRALLLEWGSYCRPTCGYLDIDPEDRAGMDAYDLCTEGGLDDGCGCPCNHPDWPEEAAS